jgi:threonine/homoserine/homoserine lactone efflux protein
MAMLGSALLLVVPVWAAALVTPGPDTLAVAHSALKGGRRAGIACAAGVCAGAAVWALGALAGLALLFERAAWAYRAVVLFGAAYLVVTGLRMLWSAWRHPRAGAGPAAGLGAASGARAAFRRGLVTHLANPKAAVFFGSLFAVALPPGAAGWAGPALAGVVVAMTAAWYGAVALAVARRPVAAAYARAERGLTGATGALLAGLGARLAWQEAR